MIVIPERRWPLGLVLATLLCSWLVSTWPWLSGAVTVPWDAKAHFYPQLMFLADALHSGQSASWNPFVFSGSPQIADPQSLIFSPPHYLLAKMNPAPGFQAADAVSFLSLLAGSVAVILYFRDRNWHQAGALVAAIAFAFGGSAAWRIQHTGQIMSLAYFPIVLFLLDRALLRSSMIYGAAAGTAAAFMVLGRDQVAGLSVVLLVAYGASYVFTGKGRIARLKSSAWPIVSGIVTGAAIIAIPMAMTLLMASESNRSFIDYEGAGRGSLHPSSLITAFVANAFGTNGEFKEFWGAPSPLWGWVDLYVARNMSNIYSGALVILALIFGAVQGALFRSGARFFGIALILMLFYTLGRYTPFFRLVYDAIPGVDMFRRPADGTFLIGALAAYAAGHAVHVIVTENPRFASRAGRLTLSISVAAVLSALALAVLKGRLHYAWPMILEGTLWLAAAFLAALFLRNLSASRPVLVTLAIAGFLTADLIRNNGPNESTALPPAMFEVLRPRSQDPAIAFLKAKTAAVLPTDRMDRVELAAIDFHWPNASIIHRLHNTLGYNPLRDKRYAETVGAGDHVALADQRNFPPSFSSYDSPLADLLGLRYLATGVPLEKLDKRIQPGRLVEVLRTNAATIYENPRALPRVMFAPRAQKADFSEIVRSGQWPRTDFEDTVLLETFPAGAPSGNETGKVRIIEFSNIEVVVDVDSRDGGYVILNDPYHPWRRAYVNGSSAVLLRANVLFNAVALPAGRYTVTFRFRPLRGLFDTLTEKISGRAQQ